MVLGATMLLLVSCATNQDPNEHTDQMPLSELDTVNFVSELLGPSEQSDRTITILLPPSYYIDEAKRYPVVYALHGFGGGPGDMISVIRNPLDAALHQRKSQEFLIVGIDGSNSLGGSLYVNSPATGNWEDMITKEIVPFVDQHYRTVPDVGHRILAGFSMGGFGAWNLTLRNPDIFCAAWVNGPGAFDPRGLEVAFKEIDETFRVAYGAAFAPDMSIPYPHARVPTFDGTPKDNLVKELWQNGFGGIEKKISDYRAKNKKLKGMRFEYATNDNYAFIIQGTPFIESRLNAAGIPTSISVWPGAHEMTREMVEKGFVPFVAEIFGSR